MIVSGHSTDVDQRPGKLVAESYGMQSKEIRTRQSSLRALCSTVPNSMSNLQKFGPGLCRLAQKTLPSSHAPWAPYLSAVLTAVNIPGLRSADFQ